MQTIKDFGAVAVRQHTPTNHGANYTTSLQTIEQALSFIPADDRDTWIKCGMAIKAELGDAGFDAWDGWSATADNYRARDAAASWRSFKASGSVGSGTLFHTAKQYGYQCDNNKPSPPTPEKIAKREAKRKAEADLLVSRRKAAADKAASIWNAPASALEATQPAITDHVYLKHKGIQPHGAKRYHGSLTIGGMACNGALMIPMKLNGKISSLQFINRNGEKRFLSDGEKGYYLIGKIAPDASTYIAEGFATGASIHEATGHAVVVAFDAGNLHKTAALLRAKYPDMVIVLCADDDETGTGQRKATEAAQAVGGLLALPEFNNPRLTGWKDFNDMATLTGLDTVKQAIDEAKPVEQKTDPVGLRLSDSNSVGNTNAPAWPIPQPLTAKIEAEPYPIDALPDTILAAVEEVGGFVKAPVPLVASSAIAALSLAIQAHYDVERAINLHGPVSTFTLVIAESGERKSTCDGFFTKAIRDYESAQAEAAKPFVKDCNAAIESWEAKRSGIKDKIRQLAKEKKPTAELEEDLRALGNKKPVPPRITRLIYGDVTPEELAFKLAMVWPSGGVVSAEAGVVFGSHGMGSDSVTRNLARLNVLWDGGDLPIDRRTTESFTVRGARLTMGLQVQSATLLSFFEKSGALARGTGFLARFLISWPESTQGNRPFTEAPEHWPNLSAFNRRITAILKQRVPIDENGSLTPLMLTLTPEAKAAWIKYHDAIEAELASGGELFDVRDVASKSADNATRLATLFHVFEGGLGAISADAFERASRIAIWHLSESRRFFGELALPAEMVHTARLDGWLIEHCKRERTQCVARRDAQRQGAVRDGARLDVAIRELVSLDRIQLRKDGKQLSIWVNPALLAEGGEL